MINIHLRIQSLSEFALTFVLLISVAGCGGFPSRLMTRSIGQITEPTHPVAHKIANPIRPDVGLSLLWVGHATVLIQIHDKLIITDPVFSKTVGLLAKRSIEAGLDPSAITRLDYILISHIHFDHFNYGSLDELPKEAKLFVPAGGISYTPAFCFAQTIAAKPWQAFEEDGLRITPVPVQHFGGRYGFDAGWNQEPTWTGYVIEYKGTTVFFAGDTGYNPELFKEIGRRFHVDVALLPIAPVEPREFMKRVHTDPEEALKVSEDVGAKYMIPIHHDTFFQGLEPEPSYAKSIMQKLIQDRGLQDHVKLLSIGEQIILKE